MVVSWSTVLSSPEHRRAAPSRGAARFRAARSAACGAALERGVARLGLAGFSEAVQLGQQTAEHLDVLGRPVPQVGLPVGAADLPDPGEPRGTLAGRLEVLRAALHGDRRASDQSEVDEMGNVAADRALVQ